MNNVNLLINSALGFYVTDRIRQAPSELVGNHK